MDKLEVGLVSGLTIVLIFILVVGYSPFSPFEGVWREEFNIREEIGKLRTQDGGNYSIHEHDWVERSRQIKDAGGSLIKIDTWEEFKANLEYHNVTFLMLDEDKRVVWFTPPPFGNQIIYFEY